MTRIAISPRFATRTFSNIARQISGCPFLVADRPHLRNHDIERCNMAPCHVSGERKVCDEHGRQRPRWRRGARTGDRSHRGRDAGDRRPRLLRLGASHWTHRPAAAARRVRGPRHGVRPMGGAALADRRRGVARRTRRHVLGHLPAHRQRPRSGAARQPGPLPDPRGPVRDLRRGFPGDRPPRGQAILAGDSDRGRLVRAARRHRDARRLRLRADRLPARRRLAPDLRPGRDPLGTDPPDADRRRRPHPDRQRDPHRRGARRPGRSAAAAVAPAARLPRSPATGASSLWVDC